MRQEQSGGKVVGGLVTLGLLLLTSPAGAMEVHGDELATLLPVDDELATSHGVRFSSNLPYVTFAVDGDGRTIIMSTDPSGLPRNSYAVFFAPIEVMFVLPSDGVTPAWVNGTVLATWGDGGGDVDYLRVRTYDLAGGLVDTVYDSDTTYSTVSTTGSGIHRVIFDQAPGAPHSSDTSIDLLVYPTPVPEPATLALLAAGMGAVWMGKRRVTR